MEPEQVADTEPAIRSVDRAARILGAFSTSQPRLTLAEIARAVGASKATAHRYTRALRDARLLRYDPRTTTFTLGPQVLGMAAVARAGFPLVASAEPFMQSLARATGETVVLSIFDGEVITIVRSIDATDRQVSIAVRQGSRIEPATSAQGKVFCAYLPREEIPLNHAVRNDSQFAGQLARIRAQGLSISGASVTGIRSIAAPVFDGERIVATMAVIGTVTTVRDDPAGATAQALLRCTRALSMELGGGAQ